MINRPNIYFGYDRKQLYIKGVGGGIKKTDSGFIFNAEYDNTGDINISDVKFESLSGAGTKVWNGDKIIRIKSLNNQYRNVDTILSAPYVFTQTTYFSNEHITGGQGWKFEAKRYLDVVIESCLVEDCVHFIRNTEALGISMCNSLRLTNNLIENLTGTVARLAGSYGLSIHNNYIEFCEEYIDLLSLATNYPHFGLSIIGNTFYLRDDQVLNSIPAIKIKNINNSAWYGNGGAFSTSNTCAAGILYDLTQLGINEFISGMADYGTILNTSRFISAGKPFVEPTSDGFTKIVQGITTTYQKHFYSIVCQGLADTDFEITTSFPLSEFSTIACNSNSTYFVIKNITKDYFANKIIITITNKSESILNCNPVVVISEIMSY